MGNPILIKYKSTFACMRHRVGHPPPKTRLPSLPTRLSPPELITLLGVGSGKVTPSATTYTHPAHGANRSRA